MVSNKAKKKGRRKMIVDVFCHHSSERIEKMIEKAVRQEELDGAKRNWTPQSAFPFPLGSAKAESRLDLMEKYGIDVQAVSQTTPALYGIGAAHAAEICARSNDENYRLCKAYPERFVNICIVSLLDVRMALDEVDRSINELDCRGVTVATNHDGKGLDSSDCLPFYEKLTAHDLPLFLHPTYWESYPLVDQATGFGLMSAFGWPFDTTQALWRLIFGGVLDQFPSLKIVTHHMGAMFPYFSGRVDTVFKAAKEKPARDLSDYWNNIYGDTAISGGTTEAYQLGYKFFGPDRLMYGSDFPFGPEAGELHIRANLAGVRSLGAQDGAMAKILGENAKKLLKI
jgi:aminocarboxymuconate-semialdehyde decarboxylase